jgi:hypothetical protein
MKSFRTVLSDGEPAAPNGGFRLSRLDRILLLAFLYGLCVNLALFLHRRYEARVFFLLGFFHVLSRIRFASPSASLRWRAALMFLMVIGLVLAIALSR